MTMEQLHDVGRPSDTRQDGSWTQNALHQEGLLAGKSNDQKKTAEDQKALTDKGIIPTLELEYSDPSATQKDKNLFQKFDSNNNNQISAGEWIDKFDKIAGEDQHASLKDFKKQFGDNRDTEQLFRDANKDGGKTVSAIEWMNRFDQLESDKDGNETIGRHEFNKEDRHEKNLFSKFDRNDNSQISAKEWVDKFDKIAGDDQTASRRDFFKAFGRNEHTENFFNAANSNGDRKVTMNEWLRFYQQLEGKDKNFTIGRKEFERYGQDGGDDAPEQFVNKPDLSKYDSQEHMEFIARIASHDQQLNGSTQPNGPQGTIFLQTLLDEQAGGTLNGQSEIFLKGDTPEETAQRRKWFFDAMADSINPETGKLDGRVLSQSIVDTIYDASGMDVSDSINRSDHQPAQTSMDALSIKGPGNPEDPGFIDSLSKHSGWSKEDIAYDLLWGHAQVFSSDGKITDEGVRDFLQNALNGKDERTSQLINSFPEIERAARDILESTHPAERLGELFLASQSKQFGVPIEANNNDHDHSGDDDYMHSNIGQNDSQKTNFFDRFLSDLKRAADSGNNKLVENTLNHFGDRFQNLANHLLKNRSTTGGNESGGQKDELQVSQRQCPFMALKDKFGGNKQS